MPRTSWSSMPRVVDDTATFERPHAYPSGIPYVLVNGVPVVDGGEQTTARPGQVLAKSLIERKCRRGQSSETMT